MQNSGRSNFNSSLDIQQLREEFLASPGGRIRIPQFLTSDAANAMYRELADEQHWNLVWSDGERLWAVPPDIRRQKGSDYERRLSQHVNSCAQTGFALLREERTAECVHQDSDRLTQGQRIREIFSSDAFADTCGQVSGRPSIGLRSLTALRYGPGHFRAFKAGSGLGIDFAFGLTPTWQLQWGGITQFLGFTGHVQAAFSPGFNTLDLYVSSTMRAVSFVTPFAGGEVYCVCGHLRP